MRYAVISDIHANLEALTSVLESIESERIGRIVCLGDLVGYYANPNECIQILRDRGIACVAGNHDRVATGAKEPDRFGQAGKKAIYWTREVLLPDNRAWLEGLPIVTAADGRFLMVHAALYPEPNDELYVRTREQAAINLKALADHSSKLPLCFLGHTHVPFLSRDRGRETTLETGEFHRLEPGARYLANPGSVGKPRDADPRASYLIFDSGELTIQFRRVDYDRETTLHKADQAGLILHKSLLVKLRDWISEL
ncbi:MAG: metallophosphoesterase family protein [Bryobacteraceae bacterium]|nr:metallophosphoesterase family protein [Bryobacteraceae bacterium]